MMSLTPVGRVESTLTSKADAPRQGDEGDGLRIHVNNLEPLDGTPVVDVKPVLTDER